MRAVEALLLAFVLAILAAVPAHAEDPAVLDMRIDAPSVVTVGDHVRYTLLLEVDEGTAVALAAAGLPPEVALVAPPETSRLPLDNGREQVTITFRLAPFIAGELFVPPLPIRYTNPDGSSGVVETVSSAIQVTSVLPRSGQITPRDLKAQAEIGTAPPTWPVPVISALVAALLLLLVAAFGRGRIVKYKIARALRRAPVYAGPEDAARGALDAAAAAFNANGDLIQYYTALGNAVRHYLTVRHQFPAFALTTRELEAEMRRLGLDRWQVRVAGGLLTQCDAVVYARYRPAGERADADLTAAYEIVEMSRPVEAASEDEREGVAVS